MFVVSEPAIWFTFSRPRPRCRGFFENISIAWIVCSTQIIHVHDHLLLCTEWYTRKGDMTLSCCSLTISIFLGTRNSVAIQASLCMSWASRKRVRSLTNVMVSNISLMSELNISPTTKNGKHFLLRSTYNTSHMSKPVEFFIDEFAAILLLTRPPENSRPSCPCLCGGGVQ